MATVIRIQFLVISQMTIPLLVECNQLNSSRFENQIQEIIEHSGVMAEVQMHLYQ